MYLRVCVYVYFYIKMHFEAAGDLSKGRAPSSGICRSSGGCRAGRKAAKDRKSCMNFLPAAASRYLSFCSSFSSPFTPPLIGSSKRQVLGMPGPATQALRVGYQLTPTPQLTVGATARHGGHLGGWELPRSPAPRASWQEAHCSRGRCREDKKGAFK